MSRLIFYIVYQVGLLLWCFHLHQYFFEFTLADKVGLAVTAAVPLLFVRIKFPAFQGLAFILLFAVPLFLFPGISYLKLLLSETWLLMYFLMLLTGFTCLSLKTHWKFLTLIPVLSVWFIPFPFQENQHKYYDRITRTIETRKGVVDIVEWKGDRWFYYNEVLAISTADGHMHTETLVHTSIPLFENPKVLLLGGDHGLTSSELEKYDIDLDHVPYDYELARRIQRRNLAIDQPIMHFLAESEKSYDAIIIDLPDPSTLEYKQYYTPEFYEIIFNQLSENGLMITNAGSPYSPDKFNELIRRNMSGHDWEVQELHAQIPTLGHRSWLIASKKAYKLGSPSIPVKTKWINQQAIEMMLAKGKTSYPF